MKLNTSDFLRKSQFPLMIASGTLPLMAFILLRCAPGSLTALLVLTPAYVLLAWLCLILPGKVRLPAGLAGCVALIILSLRLLPIVSGLFAVNSSTVRVGESVFSFLVPLLYCGFLLHGLQFAAWPREQEIAFNWYAAGVCIHLAVQLVSYAERRLGSAAWLRIQPVLVLVFIVFLLLVMLSMNRLTMHSAAQGRQRVPPTMKQRNTIITIALLACALLLAAIPAISRALKALWSLIMQGLRLALQLLAALLGEDAPVHGSGGGAGSEQMLMGAEVTEPSLLAIVLEKIAMTAALLAALALLFLALRIVTRKINELLRLLFERLNRFASAASQDYVDEITDTREDGGQTEGTLRRRLLRRMAFVNERSLSPTERIRYRYRRLLSRHPDWHASHTARENLPAEEAELYEQARYSGRESSADAADRFLRKAK